MLLPPSQTKATGGDPVPLDLPSLSFPQLQATREVLLENVIGLCSNVSRARAAIGVPASKDAELIGNTRLRTGPTMPAIRRYTGVLYDALDVAGMTKAELARAGERLAVTSALFGLLRPADPIPAYRLSAGSRPTGDRTMSALWRDAFAVVGADISAGSGAGQPAGPVVDLRSGAYAAFGAFPGAISVRVVTEMPSGARQVVSHFNKHTKGLLARALAVTRAEVTDLPGVLRVARRSGLQAERIGPAALEIVTR